MRTLILFAFLTILSYVSGALTPCTNVKDGWYKNGKFCYNFVEELSYPRTWDQAEDYCVSKLKAHLVSITTYSENTFFKSALVNEKVITYPSAWIGLKASGLGSTFKWIDGTAYSYSNWKGYRTPVTNSSSSCALVLTTTGEWIASDCSEQIRGFICKKSSSAIDPNPDPPVKVGNCPQDWYKFRGKCYKPFGNEAKDGGGMTFDNAKNICSRLNSNLVSIHSQQEQDFLTARMGELTTNVWIGLRTNSTNWRAKHYWIDKSDLNFANWATGEPSNPQREPCVEMYSPENAAGKWNDVPCNKLLGYICEKEVDPNIPVPKNMTTKACSRSFFQRYKSSCYYLGTTASDWQSADKTCSYYTGKLASINNTFEQAYISSVLAEVNATVWIGLSDTDQSKQGLFSWSDGWPVYYTKWAKDEPQPDTLYNRCVSLTSDRTWKVSNCTDKMQFLCKINDESPPDVPTIVGTCPATNKTEWIDVGNKYCYHVEYRDKEPWSGAVRQCASLAQNVKLASFHSAHELELMRPYILDTNATTGNLWIGLVQDSDGGYIWQDGTASDFVPWNNGEPKKNRYDTCVEMLGHNMKYNNLGCEQRRGYICEAPKALPPTTLPPPTTEPPRTDCGPEYKDWKYYNDSCYLIQQSWSGTYNWYESNDYCNNHGGHLLSIHSEEENEFVFKAITSSWSYFATYWIGLSATNGPFEWADETILDYDSLNGVSEELLLKDEKCVTVSRINAVKRNWNLDSCSKKQSFICKRPFGLPPTTITPKPTTSAPGYCPNGWVRTSNKCVKLFGTDPPANFAKALDSCKGMGPKGTLMTIQNDAEQSLATTLLIGVKTNVWIGLRKLSSGREFEWADNSRYKYANWGTGQPADTFLSGLCGAMQSSRTQPGTWKTVLCEEKAAYICQISPSTSVVTTPTPKADCWTKVNGFVKYGNSCFKLYKGSDSKATWNEAETACKGAGGHLASLNSGLEQNLINTIIYLQNVTEESFWIGLKENENRFKWADNWPVYYTNWADKEPKSVEMGFDRCVYLDTASKQWKAEKCIQTRNFICETSKDEPPVIPKVSNLVCPSHANGYEWLDPEGSQYCYYIENGYQSYKRMSWGDASMVCSSLNGEIASFHSQHEIDLLSPLLKQSIGKIWIGLVKKHHGGYEWSDKTPLDFLAWDENQPGELSTYYPPCGALNPSNGKWQTVSCNQAQGFVCRLMKVQSNVTSPVVTKATSPASESKSPVTDPSKKSSNSPPVTDPSKSSKTPPATEPNTTPTPTVTVTGTSKMNATETSISNTSNAGMGGGAVAAIVIFVILAVIASLGIGYYYLKRRSMLPSMPNMPSMSWSSNKASRFENSP